MRPLPPLLTPPPLPLTALSPPPTGLNELRCTTAPLASPLSCVRVSLLPLVCRPLSLPCGALSASLAASRALCSSPFERLRLRLSFALPPCPCLLPSLSVVLLSLVCRVCLPHAVIARVHFSSKPFLLKVSCSLAFTSWVPWIALSPGRSLLHAHPQPCGLLSPRSLRLVVATRGGSSTLPRYSIPASAGSSQQCSL